MWYGPNSFASLGEFLCGSLARLNPSPCTKRSFPWFKSRIVALVFTFTTNSTGHQGCWWCRFRCWVDFFWILECLLNCSFKLFGIGVHRFILIHISIKHRYDYFKVLTDFRSLIRFFYRFNEFLEFRQPHLKGFLLPFIYLVLIEHHITSSKNLIEYGVPNPINVC